MMLVVFCLQGHSPVNLPDYPYNTQDICSPTDLAQLVQQSRGRLVAVLRLIS